VRFQDGGPARLSGNAKALIAVAAGLGALFPLALAGLIIVTLVASPARGSANLGPAPNASRVQCQPVEQLARHFHSQLVILEEGQSMAIPANIGIASSCIYWLHTHDTSGVIHVETPVTEIATTFTLGDFFSVWGQAIDSRHAGLAYVGPGQSMRVWVQDGPSRSARSWSKNPAAIPLRDCESITIDIGSGAAVAPQYGFPTDFGCDA
jgi:hypothetical protein